MNDTIAQFIYNAYVNGLMQYNALEICGIRVSMHMFTHFNQLSFSYNSSMLSIAMYDSDSEPTQECSILNLINDLRK